MNIGGFKYGAPECERTFGSSGALLRHRPSCIHYQQQSVARANFRLERKRVLCATEPGMEPTELVIPTTVKKTKLCGNKNDVPGEPAFSGLPTSTLPELPQAANDSSLPTHFPSSGVVDIRPNNSSPTSIDIEHSQPFASSSSAPSRPVRPRRLPACFRDPLPEPSLSLPDDSESSNNPGSTSVLPRVILHVFDSFRTSFNTFGIARCYRHRPSYDPNAFLTIDQLSNTTVEPQSESPALDIPSLPPAPPWPWKNMGIWRLMTWMLTGSNQKSKSEVTRLVHEVILADDFDPSNFAGFNAQTLMKHFDKSEEMK